MLSPPWLLVSHLVCWGVLPVCVSSCWGDTMDSRHSRQWPAAAGLCRPPLSPLWPQSAWGGTWPGLAPHGYISGPILTGSDQGKTLRHPDTEVHCRSSLDSVKWTASVQGKSAWHPFVHCTSSLDSWIFFSLGEVTQRGWPFNTQYTITWHVQCAL